VHAAGKTFRNPELLPEALNARPATGGAYRFPEAASFRISFSSVRSDTALRRRAFSASRSFSRVTWSLLRPPYSWRSGNTLLPSRLSTGSLPPPIGPPMSIRRPDAAWRQSLQAYGAFYPSQNPPKWPKIHTSRRITFQRADQYFRHPITSSSGSRVLRGNPK
jgi:hypothetical protein